MRVMKQVLPGVDLPVTYLSNGAGFDVEGAEPDEGGHSSGNTERLGQHHTRHIYHPKLPTYKTAAGDHVMRLELTKDEIFDLLHDPGNLPSVLLINSVSDMLGSIENVTMDEIKIAIRDKLAPVPAFPEEECRDAFRTGNVWLTFSGTAGFFRKSLSLSCPFSAEDEREKRLVSASGVAVIMAARDMVPDGGVAKIVKISRENGKHGISGHAGVFDTENDAIAAIGSYLREDNRGKWHSGKDMAGLKGDAGAVPEKLCTVCAVSLMCRVSKGVRVSVEYYCPKCGDIHDAELFSGVKENLTQSFRNSCVRAGFTEQQARFIQEMMKK